MATTEPQKWAATLGSTADVNAIPATTPSGSGRASFSGLFPPVTQLPLDQGGIAPERGDFNALFKYLGEYIYYAMQGGVYTYVTTYDYTAGNFVLHGGSLYLCIAANGPGSAVKYPTDTAYWRQLALTSQLPTVNNGTLTIQNNGATVATFSANQAGNTTANISVPTVNNGTLTIQKDGATVATFTANQAGNTTANISVPAVNNGVLTIQKNGTTVATFSANQAGNTTANITAPAAAPGVFDVGSTVIRAAPGTENINYGVLTSHGYFHSWCCDSNGGVIGDAGNVYHMPGTWIICCGVGDPSSTRGVIMRRIA